jgi:hypothetical protein
VRVRNLLEMCSGGLGGINRYLFEVAPDLFPQGFLTDIEIALWARHFDNKAKNRSQQ